ncbi:hypothetical protein H1W00_12475 [Aeromicrobium sp. Marseille-Q0843]|uniref:Uncharacterized protein n=1 Tax=Aeromicrobium phoceense TaxID=2754045 RepID=A0A838XHG8_9ACTN|nr:hypothetical protein [Aeromicrobium phoceense]MBA4609297.1 hypothetical protein [Aeromicrobium phoceense]
MNEEVVEMLVRLACGVPSEPPIVGTVVIGGRRHRGWKHAERGRGETPEGRLQMICDGERLLSFSEGSDRPFSMGAEAFGLHDEDAPWHRLARPSLRDLELSERRADGPVERGERFGRATVSVTLDHTYHDDFPLHLVLDAVTGMPFEMTEARSSVLRWTDLEVLDSIDEEQWRWDGSTGEARWFGYVGVDDELVGDVPPSVREQFREAALRGARLAEELNLPAMTAEVPLAVEVGSFEPGIVTIDLEGDAFVSVRGQASPDPEGHHRAQSQWTTADGWTWTLHASGVTDEQLFATLRDHVTAWRDSRSPSNPD